MPVGGALADRDLVDPDYLGRRVPRSAELLSPVLHFQLPDGPPVQMRLLGDVFDRHGPTTSSDEKGETLGVERMVRQPVQSLLLHLAAALALDAPNLHFQVDPHFPARPIAHSACLAVGPTSMRATPGATGRFFPRRWRRRIRALKSPKMPRTVEIGRKSEKRYASHRRQCFRIRRSCQIPGPRRMP
jgi:hypothetical protein